MKKLIIFLSIILIVSCKTQSKKIQLNLNNDKPNILWIVTEDISPTLSMYGDSTAKTPNLDALAKESLIYDNAFTTVGVCAPSRSSIITGMYPTTLGTMHMRVGKDIFSWGKRKYKKNIDRKDIQGNSIRQYSAVIPDYVKCFTEYLRINGYYCTNNQKTDYQFAAPISAWDENNGKAHWRNRPKDKPFFSVFNIGITHESRLWRNENLPLTVNPKDVKVPPYLPDNFETRKTIARNYSNIELMDKELGEFIRQLKEDGLYDKTIIFFYSDHGGPLPRQKREIYDSGLKVPLMIKSLNSKTKGRSDRLISFVDFAPTVLSLANIPIPGYIEGNAFLGIQDKHQRKNIFASSDRFDEFTDRIRAVRNKRFLYIRNYFPELPKYKDIAYRKNIPMMQTFLKMKEDGQLNETQMLWFQTKTSEELYNCQDDPDNLNNLINNYKYKDILEELRNTLDVFQSKHQDLGQILESELIQNMWPDFKQPKTENPEIIIDHKYISISCPTKGSSINYQFSNDFNKAFNFDDDWQIYSKPIIKTDHKYLYVISERIGYKKSDMIKIKL